MPGPGAKLALASPLAVLPLLGWTLAKPGRWLPLFFFAALLLPPLPVHIGDSGPHIALAIAALGVFVGMLRAGEWRFKPDFLSSSLLIYFSVLVMSVSVAALYSGPAIAAGTLARVFLFGISLYVFFYTAYGPGTGSDVRTLFCLAAGSAALACIDFYYQLPAPAGFGPQFVWLDSGVYRRAQGVFYEASTLGNLCAFFLVMIAAALLRPKAERPLSSGALAIGGVLFAAALMFSYSRASLLNVLVAGAVLVWLHRGRIRIRTFAILGAIGATVAVAAGYALPAFAELYWGRLRGTAEYLFSATGAVLSGRPENWQLLGRFLIENPLSAIVGVGYKTLPYSSVTGHPIVVDNMYLSMLAETGLVGVAALLLINLAILRAAFRAARSSDQNRSFLGAWMFSFWSGQLVQMFSCDLLTYWRVLPVYFWVLALAVREHDDSTA
jgi:hypothetical protein